MKVEQLLEGAASSGKLPVYTSVQVENAIKMLNARCKDALWMLHENRPIYRGDDRSVSEQVATTGFATAEQFHVIDL